CAGDVQAGIAVRYYCVARKSACDLALLITVAVPTHNRASMLGETLAAICALEIPAGAELECVVIDNASTDDTGAVVDAAAVSAPFPMRRAMEERGLDAACGMVIARWAAPPPSWLGPSLWVKLAVHVPERIDRNPAGAEKLENYFSANVGFRRSAFERFGRFREDLGVVGGNPISGEDTELFERIVARGGRMGFVPRAIVHHMVPAERMTRAYLRRKSFAYGFGSAIAGGKSHNRIDKLVRNAVRMTRAMMRGDRERAIYHELECANFMGYWRGRIAASHARPSR